MHRITTTSQNTDQDVISSSSRWSVSEMMPRTLHPFYFLLMATFNQVRIHPAKLSTHSTCSGPISASWRDWPWNLYLSSKVQSPLWSGCALGLGRMRAKQITSCAEKMLHWFLNLHPCLVHQPASTAGKTIREKSICSLFLRNVKLEKY